jgi:hypothetical protein
METVDALEGSFSAAPALFKAGQLRGNLRGFLLQAFALLAQQVASLACNSSRRCLGGGMLGLKALGLLALLLDGEACLASRASLLRAACNVHSCRRRSMRCASASICLSAAPWLAVSRLGLAALFAARFQLRSQFLNGAGQRRGFRLRLCQGGFEFGQRFSVSRNSRLSASGPSLAGLPPVTVVLWKHSPLGVRK